MHNYAPPIVCADDDLISWRDMSSRFTIITSMLAVAAGVSGAGAQEAAFPNKPIRLIMPNAPGSSNDVLSRLLAIKLGEILGQQVVIDNRAGAGGTIGVETAAHAVPDGYTLVAASSATHSIAPHVYSKLNYDVNRDFTPISLFVITQNLLAVHPSIPAKTVREFIDYAKSKPGTLNMASAGAGSTSHLAGVMFTTLAHIQSVHVPYKGGGPSVAAVVAGEAQWVFTPIAGPLPHVRSGRLRALAVGGVQRSPVAPEIPTVAESGVPGYNSSGWNGIMGPRGLPKPIVAKLHDAIAKALASPDVKESFAAQGAEPFSDTPEQFAQHVRNEYVRFGKAVKDAGLKVE
jgi:tripartite-type tricarboxylate transporter receptor subunit TctC